MFTLVSPRDSDTFPSRPSRLVAVNLSQCSPLGDNSWIIWPLAKHNLALNHAQGKLGHFSPLPRIIACYWAIGTVWHTTPVVCSLFFNGPSWVISDAPDQFLAMPSISVLRDSTNCFFTGLRQYCETSSFLSSITSRFHFLILNSVPLNSTNCLWDFILN